MRCGACAYAALAHKYHVLTHHKYTVKYAVIVQSLRIIYYASALQLCRNFNYKMLPFLLTIIFSYCIAYGLASLRSKQI